MPGGVDMAQITPDIFLLITEAASTQKFTQQGGRRQFTIGDIIEIT
jgi:hypothetical protein